MNQGCQMAYFQTKNLNLGRYWRVLQWKMLDYSAIWSILRLFGIVCDHLAYFRVIGYIFFLFLVSIRRKCGNPGMNVVVKVSL
jgi:hypothetical protein